MLGKMQSKAKLYIYSIVLSSRPQRTRVQSGACKHRGDGDGQTGARRLHHQQRRDRMVQVGAQRPGRHPPGGGRGAVGQGDNDGIIIYFKQYAITQTVCLTPTRK